MRYYEIHLPGKDDPAIVTNLKTIRDLPEGTRIYAVVTERDGSLADYWEIPVEGGAPAVQGRAKHTPKYEGLR